MVDKIDDGIARFVDRMNRCGLETVESCSGLYEDHGFPSAPSYLCFIEVPKLKEAILSAGWSAEKHGENAICAVDLSRHDDELNYDNKKIDNETKMHWLLLERSIAKSFNCDE